MALYNNITVAMATVSAVVSSSPTGHPPRSFSNPTTSLPFKTTSITRSETRTRTRTRLTWLNPHPRGALIEATPPPNSALSPSPKDGSFKVLALPETRADDLQAEARALARAANASVYTPQLVASKYGSQPLKVVGRALKVLSALGLFGLKLLVDQRSGVLDQNKRIRAIELRDSFTRLGPTFVKLGQGLSTRPDICPPEYLEELSQLQDGLPTFPDDQAFACIERELGQSLDSIFSTISPTAVAAASLGQVYKAQLKYSGKLVAVKVQRPDIEEAIGLDFYLIRGLGFLINKYVDFITSDVVALIDEFARRVFQELNYVQVSAGGTKC